MYIVRLGRYARSNRHISHVRFTTLKRGRQRVMVSLVIFVIVIVYYKLKTGTKFVEEILEANGEMSESSRNYRQKMVGVVSERSHIESARATPLKVPASAGMHDRTPQWEISPSLSCKNSSPFLVILIASHSSNTETRDVIRSSWCRRKKFPEGRSMTCVFLLGNSDERLREDVNKESMKTGDILKGDFPDNFRNSTKKLLLGLHWIRQACSNSKYIMKTEDDVIVNTKAAMNKLSNTKFRENTFMGKCWSDEPNRNPKSRFYVSVDAYPRVGYPEYCSGAGYIMSGDVAKRLYEASATSESFLPFDEVFAGVQLERLGISPIDVPRFILSRFDESSPCKRVSEAVAVHVHGLDMKHVWELLEDCKGGIR